MGEMAEFYIDQMLGIWDMDWRDSFGANTFEHPLDQRFWVGKDGRHLYPNSGKMDISYIENCLAFLQKPEIVDKLREWGWKASSIAGEWDDDAQYIEKRIKKSLLWKALCNGLNELRKRIDTLNDGIIKW